jgi:hypothetical protein
LHGNRGHSGLVGEIENGREYASNLLAKNEILDFIRFFVSPPADYLYIVARNFRAAQQIFHFFSIILPGPPKMLHQAGFFRPYSRFAAQGGRKDGKKRPISGKPSRMTP